MTTDPIISIYVLNQGIFVIKWRFPIESLDNSDI